MSHDFGNSESPRERSTYSSFSDGYSGFDAREEESGNKGILVVGLALGVVLVFGTVVWNAYRAGVKDDVKDTPVIRADAGDFKKRPVDEGGFTTPNQDKRLFDAIDSYDRAAEIPASTENSAVRNPPKPDGIPKDIRPKGSVPDEVPAPVVTPKPLPAPSVTPAPVVTAPVENTASSSLLTPRMDQTGNYLVQLAALRDVPAAQKVWSQMVEAYPDMFAGAEMDIQRADLGARGIFYRVRVSAFADREAADQFCNALKARNETCIVATRN